MRDYGKGAKGQPRAKLPNEAQKNSNAEAAHDSMRGGA
jgi:hypothetical protein